MGSLCAHLSIISQFIGSNKFVLFFLNEVLPQLDKIPKEMEHMKFVHLELLKVYSECSASCKPFQNGSEVIEKAVNVLYVCVL